MDSVQVALIIIMALEGLLILVLFPAAMYLVWSVRRWNRIEKSREQLQAIEASMRDGDTASRLSLNLLDKKKSRSMDRLDTGRYDAVTVSTDDVATGAARQHHGNASGALQLVHGARTPCDVDNNNNDTQHECGQINGQVQSSNGSRISWGKDEDKFSMIAKALLAKRKQSLQDGLDESNGNASETGTTGVMTSSSVPDVRDMPEQYEYSNVGNTQDCDPSQHVYENTSISRSTMTSPASSDGHVSPNGGGSDVDSNSRLM